MKCLFFLLLSTTAFADISLDEAYKRERSFLSSQKEALLKMKTQLNASLAERKTKAEKDITFKQEELSRLQLQNQELHEEYKALEKVTKESSQMAGQLEKNALKIKDQHAQLRAKLGLLNSDMPLENEPVKRFEQLLAGTQQLIQTLSKEEWRTHAFLDEKDHLVQGEVLFMGLFSAIGKIEGKLFNLAPYNNEFLRVIGSTQGSDLYFFSPNFERTGFKAAKTWKESVADAIPGVVMLIIMAAVLGLFILLARA